MYKQGRNKSVSYLGVLVSEPVGDEFIMEGELVDVGVGHADTDAHHQGIEPESSTDLQHHLPHQLLRDQPLVDEHTSLE